MVFSFHFHTPTHFQSWGCTCQALTNLRKLTPPNSTLSATFYPRSPRPPVLVMGDLNCHLGHLGGPKSSDSPNSRGVKWKQVIDHHCLYVPSLSSLAQGPVHTYQCSDISTTLDYVLGNQATSVALSSCDTVEDHPLNTSDHLPLVTKLSVNLLTRPTATSDGHPPLDWHSSASDGSSTIYAQHTDALVRPFIDKDYSSIEELENDLAHVSRSLLTISASTIPHK